MLHCVVPHSAASCDAGGAGCGAVRSHLVQSCALAVRCGGVQRVVHAGQYSAVECIAVQYNALCGSAVQCNEVVCSAVQCSAVQYV